jgi:hypothetical protein
VTKTFNLKSGTSGDRVAFFVKARNNIVADSVNPNTSACYNCNVAGYTVIGASGNDASCNGSSTTTDGSNEATNNDGNTDNGTNDNGNTDNGSGGDNGTNTGINAFNQIQLTAHN